MEFEVMGAWTKRKLVDVADEKRIAYLPSCDEHLPYIGLEHIEQQSLTLSGIGDSAETGSQKKKFQSGDVLYGSLRPYFRKIYRPKFDGVCSTDITVLSAKKRNEDSFLFYLLAGKEFIDKASGASNGTKMPRAGWSIVKDFEFTIPDIKTQARIASVLSVYDDLIENNEKRIKILEEMAERLYREWFVKFKFPGHEKVRLVDSGTEYGEIPEGWEVKQIQDLYDTSSGGTPNRNNKNEAEFYSNASIPWVKTKELNDNYILDTEEKITEIAVKKSSAKIFPKNTVLIAMYGATIGKLGILSLSAATNQACCAFLLKEADYSSYYIFQFLKSNTKKITSLAFGAAQPNISQNTMKNIDILKPSKGVLELYNRNIDVIFNEIFFLQRKNKNQSKIRDLLIPQLVTGKREVK